MPNNDLPPIVREFADMIVDALSNDLSKRIKDGLKGPSVNEDEPKRTHAASPRPPDGTFVTIEIQGRVRSLPDGCVIVIDGDEEWWLAEASVFVREHGKNWR